MRWDPQQNASVLKEAHELRAQSDRLRARSRELRQRLEEARTRLDDWLIQRPSDDDAIPERDAGAATSTELMR